MYNMVDSALSQTLQDTDQGAYQLDRRDVAKILYALDARDCGQLVTAMDPLHPADIADLLEQMNPFDRSRLIRLYDRAFDGEIPTELQEGLREEIIDLLKPDVLANAVRKLATDDVVDLVEDLNDNQQEAVIEVLTDADRVAVVSSLNYPEHSAGILMQCKMVIAPQDWQVWDAIDHLRATDNLPRQFYHVTLVDRKTHPVSNVSLGRLMATRCNVALKDIAEEILQVIPATQAEADVAYAFNQYHLISTPVVDEDGLIVGVITIYDAMVVLDEEHEEDILRLAGVGDGSLSDTVLQTTWQCVPWLTVNLGTSILASTVIAQFEATIESFVALAVVMPIIASMGGNTGTQSLTVVVRALATKDLTASNVWRVIRREVFSALINRVFFAVLMGMAWQIWFNSSSLGYVIVSAMVINFMTAGLAGTGVPIILDRFGIHTALASSAFVTIVTDVIGFLAFLGLAVWVLF